MLLTDWFFTASTRQQPLDASALLESLAVLRDAHAPAAIRRFALEHLAECDELARAYAIPQLIRLLFQPYTGQGPRDGVRDVPDREVEAAEPDVAVVDAV